MRKEITDFKEAMSSNMNSVLQGLSDITAKLFPPAEDDDDQQAEIEQEEEHLTEAKIDQMYGEADSDTTFARQLYAAAMCDVQDYTLKPK